MSTPETRSEDSESADSETSAEGKERTDAKPNLHPLDGGIWRPVAPEELIRRNVNQDQRKQSQASKITPERRQYLERYLRDRPADIDAYLELATIYREMGRTVEAKRVLKTALELEPEHPKILWELEESELARSLQQLRDVKELAQKLHTSEVQRELERAKLDWAHRRISVCRARLNRNPQNHHLRVIMAEALRELGENQEAIKVLEPALTCDVESPQAYLILGNCRLCMGDNLGALSAWRHAGMRREVPAPAKIRIQALKSAIQTAETLGLSASLKIYRQALALVENSNTSSP